MARAEQIPVDSLPRPSLVSELEARLRADIAEGRLAPGALLPTERELSARHGVARATVKQALVRLEQVGLIETRHGVGSRVRDTETSGAGAGVLRWLVGLGDPGWLDELFEARGLVGPLIARQAAARATPAQGKQLAAALERLRDAPTAEALHAAENELHRRLAAASGNRVLRLMVEAMIRSYAPVRSLMHGVFADRDALSASLGEVVGAVLRGEPDAAEESAQRYFDATGPSLRAALGTKPKRRPR